MSNLLSNYIRSSGGGYGEYVEAFSPKKKSDKKSAINGKSRRLNSSAGRRITREISVFVIMHRKLCQSKILSFF